MEATKSEWMEVRRSEIHGKGIFASKDIPKGTKIIEYVGEKITKKEADRRADEILEASKLDPAKGGVYIFELNKRYDIDGNVSWNTARLINHSCDPNCESENDDGKIWIMAMEDIKKGDELGYDYGYDLVDFDEHPCECGSENCVGFIVHQKHWGRLKKRLEKR